MNNPSWWWDESVQRQLRAAFPDWERTAGIFAITSINQGLAGNATLTRRVYDAYPDIPPVIVVVRHKLLQFYDTGVVAGRKIEAFHRALLGDPQAIPVDLWMLRAFGIRGKATDRKTEAVQDKVRQLARRWKKSPRWVQETLWVRTRRASGVYTESSPTLW